MFGVLACFGCLRVLRVYVLARLWAYVLSRLRFYLIISFIYTLLTEKFKALQFKNRGTYT